MSTSDDLSFYPNADRVRRFSTAGDQSSFGMGLYNNNFVHQISPNIGPNLFVLPEFSANTGTLDFYGQSLNSVMAMYARPFLSFGFTANTDVFTSDTRLLGMQTDIHKIRYADVMAYRADPTQEKRQIILHDIHNPFAVYSASTVIVDSGGSDITSAFTYTILPEQRGKTEDRFTEPLFQDRGQYFVNLRYTFLNTATTIGSTVSWNTNGSMTRYPYSSSTHILTTGPISRITRGNFSGEVVQGYFFTCLQPPSKPILEFPFPATSATPSTTFTPTFNFSNVEDGDEYILEVTYNLEDVDFEDTLSTSGVSSYRRSKTDDSLEQMVNRTDAAPVGTELTSTRRSRRINVPLRPDSEFLYRVGNSRSIINIFGIKNEIITYSSHLSGVTGSEQNVKLAIDSKLVKEPASGATSVPITIPDKPYKVPSRS